MTKYRYALFYNTQECLQCFNFANKFAAVRVRLVAIDRMDSPRHASSCKQTFTRDMHRFPPLFTFNGRNL